MKTSRKLVINFSIILLLALLLMAAHGVSTAEELSGEELSGEMGDPNDMYLRYTISGADFSKDTNGDNTFVGFSEGGPVTISGVMTVTRAEGMKSGVSMDAYLGHESLKLFPKEGEDGNVMGKTVTRTFSMTYNPVEGEEIVMGRATLYVCGGVCTEYTFAVHVFPLEGNKFGPQIDEEEAQIRASNRLAEKIRATIDCSKCEGKVKIASFGGEVEVIKCGDNDDDRMFMRMHMKICDGDRIITHDESWVILQFLDLSTFVMHSNSEIVIMPNEKQKSNLELIFGKIMVNVERMMAGDSLVIRTNRCVTGVEGTKYVLQDDGTKTTLKTLEGKVNIESIASGEKNSVEAGEMIIATDTGLTEIETFDIAAEEAEWEIDELEDSQSSVGSEPASESDSGSGSNAAVIIVPIVVIAAFAAAIFVFFRRRAKAVPVSPIPAPSNVESSFCNQCGNQVPRDAAFCKKCGSKM